MKLISTILSVAIAMTSFSAFAGDKVVVQDVDQVIAAVENGVAAEDIQLAEGSLETILAGMHSLNMISEGEMNLAMNDPVKMLESLNNLPEGNAYHRRRGGGYIYYWNPYFILAVLLVAATAPVPY